MSDFLTKWKHGLEKTRKVAFGTLATIFGASEITDETWEDLEAVLLQADLGLNTSESIITAIQATVASEGLIHSDELQAILKKELKSRLMSPPQFIYQETPPTVILVVGVNGSGKTTTIAKLGYHFQQFQKSVLFGAGDTYRAAAVEQLKTWGTRLNIPVIAGQSGGDPGAVAYDTVASAVAKETDIALIDTAGRLHTRFNLMEELRKVYRVTSKPLAGAPHHVWLVLDATTGQNAIQQARAFKEAVNVNGIILTKLDSSSKGGMAFSIQQELQLPILFVGLGEKMDDLQAFDQDQFINGLFSTN
ncbi:MAG: signal recognition particle-docking protein FtsY [Anaerolineaceae bacterium]|nr:signal recognition particle-docking protein FtsY [Anaerolineaceae bacterium]